MNPTFFFIDTGVSRVTDDPIFEINGPFTSEEEAVKESGYMGYPMFIRKFRRNFVKSENGTLIFLFSKKF